MKKVLTQNTTASHSFVILNTRSVQFIEEILEPLELVIIEDESDIDLGYYTVSGPSESIAELKDYLYNSHRI